MKIKNKFIICLLFCGFFAFSCNPYKGFEGVNPKGMKKNESPSVKLREEHKKSEKKMQRKYRREMKKRKRKMGNSKK